MAQKKALTDEELLAQLDAPTTPAASTTKTGKQPQSSSKQSAPLADDPLAELESLAKAKPVSRPQTPKPRGNVAPPPPIAAAAAAAAVTPASTPAGSARNSSEDNGQKFSKVNPPRKSGDSARSYHQGLTPTSEEEEASNAAAAIAAEEEESRAASAATAATTSGGGGGWGGWFSGITATATAAVKQAEQYAKEIQKNEEAQKWTETLRGTVGDLRGIGGDLRSRALPTFTSIINTIAPPISSHERLQIHITHDLIGYPSLDPTIHAVFSRVMSQVEGGDLIVIQRASESSQRRSSDAGFRGGSNGWHDGPWWRDGLVKRDLGIVQGLNEGTKLVRVSAEAYAKEFFDARGGVENAAEAATKILSETNPVRSSDVFIAIQAIGHGLDNSLFQSTAEEQTPKDEPAGGIEDAVGTDDIVVFAFYLHDPIHGISFKALSQGLPRNWVEWMDAENVQDDEFGPQLPEEIAEIVQSGGVDPREWVAEWMEETISLAAGVVAQRYVARRMGVGEGGIGKGKRRQEFDEAPGGEAARVGVI